MRASYRTSVNLGNQPPTEQTEYLARPYSSQYPTSSQQQQQQQQYPASPTRQYPSSPLRDPSYVPDFTTPAAAPSSPSKSFPVNVNPNLSQHVNPNLSQPYNTRPLDRPTHVRRAASETAMPPPSQPSDYNTSDSKQDPDQDNVKLIPSMSDKPTGLSADDFLPNKFGKMSVSNSSPFGWPQTELSESEVTSSILKGHTNMMAVLTAR